jgi:phage baseplate assembly protein W
MTTPALDDLVRRRVLGRGLVCAEIEPGLDLGRDLQLTSGPTGVDLTALDGIDNLGQCLEIGLTTALGSDVFNTGFGFDGINALVDGTQSMLVREQVRISVIKLLQADSRVRSIIDLQVLDGRLLPQPGAPAGATLEERIDAWRTLDVNVSFEVITGDQATVSLGKGVTNG